MAYDFNAGKSSSNVVITIVIIIIISSSSSIVLLSLLLLLLCCCCCCCYYYIIIISTGNEQDLDWQLSAWLKERINSEILRLTSNGYYQAKKILTENEDLLWALARRLIQDDQVSQEEFHFMLYEFNAKTVPYGLYGDTKIDEMPYQNDPKALAEDLFNNIPKFSDLIPKSSELTNPDAIARLPELLKK
jgi:hypothetical protein